MTSCLPKSLHDAVGQWSKVSIESWVRTSLKSLISFFRHSLRIISGFQFLACTQVKLKFIQSLSNAVNQSELEVETCNQCQVRENARKRPSHHCFWFCSWLDVAQYMKFLQPVTGYSSADSGQYLIENANFCWETFYKLIHRKHTSHWCKMIEIAKRMILV